MHYRRRDVGPSNSRWEVWVDGNGWLIAAWSQQLERDLPVVAEGFRGEIPQHQGILIARSLVARWHDMSVPDDYRRRDPGRIRTTATDEGTHVWTLLDWPEPNDLAARLFISDDLVARWLVFDLPEEPVIEEIHTMCERVLRLVTRSGQRVSFATMVDRAVEAGFLRASAADHLRELNTMRREFRHRGRMFASDDERAAVRDEVFAAFYVLDTLLDQTGDG